MMVYFGYAHGKMSINGASMIVGAVSALIKTQFGSEHTDLEVLAAFIGKRERKTFPAPSWK